MSKLLGQARLQLLDLAVGYGRGRHPHRVAEGINLSLHCGELVALVGPNGSGKSTLLRTLCGLQQALQGKVLLDGENLHSMEARSRARRMAVAFSSFVPMAGMTGGEYVALGRIPFSNWLDRQQDHDRRAVAVAMEQTDTAGFSNRQVRDLSDGERQRLALARALAQEPRVLLLDEPTAFLDVAHRVSLFRTLGELARQRGLCVILSTHELELALQFADRLLVMDGHGAAQCNLPEVLALDGVLDRVFSSTDVAFDLESGSFRACVGHGKPIICLGGSELALWTRRALRRKGWEVRTSPEAEQDAQLPWVQCPEREGIRHWRVVLPGGDGAMEIKENLMDVLAFLDERMLYSC